MTIVEGPLTDALVLGRRKLNSAFSAFPPHFIDRGELLTVPGCRSAMFRLRTGWAYYYRQFSNGRTAVLDIYLPGDLIGLDALFGTQRLKAVSTLTWATLEVIPAEDGLLHLMADRSIALYICWSLGQRQRRTDRRLAANSHLEPEARLALMLLDFHVRLGRQRLITGLMYNLPLTQTQIGNYLGLSAIHVNRVFRSFRNDRTVSVERGCVTILSIERLKTLARGEPALAPASPVVETAAPIP